MSPSGSITMRCRATRWRRRRGGSSGASRAIRPTRRRPSSDSARVRSVRCRKATCADPTLLKAAASDGMPRFEEDGLAFWDGRRIVVNERGRPDCGSVRPLSRPAGRQAAPLAHGLNVNLSNPVRSDARGIVGSPKARNRANETYKHDAEDPLVRRVANAFQSASGTRSVLVSLKFGSLWRQAPQCKRANRLGTGSRMKMGESLSSQASAQYGTPQPLAMADLVQS